MKRPVYAMLMFALLAGSFLGGAWYNQRSIGKPDEKNGGRKVLYYVDPMNPAHTTDKPGAAPCGMPMEPVYSDEGAGDPPRAMPPGTAKITPEKQQMIGVRVEPVAMTAKEHALRTLGRVAADENRTYRIIAGADGWVWDVRESTTDSVVQKDQLMATIYNYQFLAREQQYLYALDYAQRSSRAESQKQAPLVPGAREDWGSLPMDEMAQQLPGAASGLNPTGNIYHVEDQVELAKLELYNLGAGDYQLQELARTKRISAELQVRSPVTGIVLSRNVSPWQKFDKGVELFKIADLSRVWILTDVFEGESRYIRPGAMARVSLPGQGKVFQGKVTEVPPRFDQATRTLKVRIDVENPDFELRPDMFVDVELLITLPPSINVPVDAVIDSGITKTVFVDRGNGYFEPRSVETGWRFGDRVEIAEGLTPGEKIVVSGNFLIDSESRMKLAAAGLFGALEKDPVCGMQVDSSKAQAAGMMIEGQGRTYYFCSEECKKKFSQPSKPMPPSPQADAMERAAPSASHEAHGEPSPSSMAPSGQPAGLSKDPVCGMPVHENKANASALTSEYGGKTFHFCSEHCKKTFDENPGRFAGKAAEKELQIGASHAAGPSASTPHPQHEFMGPGPSPASPSMTGEARHD